MRDSKQGLKKKKHQKNYYKTIDEYDYQPSQSSEHCALKGSPTFLMFYVYKLSISVFPAAVGRELNVSSFPFLLSHEVGQTPWYVPVQNSFCENESFP